MKLRIMRSINALLALACCSLGIASTKPNIIFILADDLGYGDLGCYGQKNIKTPYLDKMARDGTRFTQCYSGSTVCAPSRSALLTGLTTGHCGHRGNKAIPMLPEEITVGEVLKGAGYNTAVIGKWGMGEPGSTGTPDKQGFDYFFGFLNHRHAHNHYPEYVWRNNEKVTFDGSTYALDEFTSEALAYVRSHRDHPFFLYLCYTVPHAQMQVPDLGPYKDRNWPEAEKAKAAMISRMDEGIGQLFTTLKSVGIDDRTVVFFTSDNGPHTEGGVDPKFHESNGPLRGIKRDLYEGGIRVPMIVRWPGNLPAGKVSDQLWAFWDFLPTAAEIAGVKPPISVDGISMLPALHGKRQTGHDFLYWEFHEGGTQQAIRQGDWKLVKYHGGATELFNLEKDLSEKRNVAKRHPAVVKELTSYLAKARTESTHWPMTPFEGRKKRNATETAKRMTVTTQTMPVKRPRP